MDNNITTDEDGLIVNPTHGGTGGPLDTSTPLTPEMQAEINAPLADPMGLDMETQEFLQSTMARVYNGQIDTYKPSSLINQAAYDQLDQAGEGLADQTAVIFCGKLRDIRGLMDISGGEQSYAAPTYQIQQLVKELKFHKEEFEKQYGDVFVI
ncbi:hypothetical protein COV81_04625 [Candidatus Peregrinibacteria bacterium CG11_big_fil_rev_8_21_14_0_20_41_10]|nr:MAG: hypothetical protein COV81_04625 [Candidatus Peregrinibacteria bacterium CG11_big_fil_rev_8_21_14_0_20_41_10]PJC37719.1 MAG: hypothetical protein CO045_04050 [Candidatus Peregrinibacteria bacterium CG_4_9_14_0_2_um_filter_41_14]